MTTRLTVNFTFEDDEGEEHEVSLPGRYEICGNCQGHGQHAHAIDGDGITSSEWDEWDEDDRETYMSGGYDQPCEECDGTGKVVVVDEVTADPELLKRYQDHARFEAECRAEDRYNQRMGY